MTTKQTKVEVVGTTSKYERSMRNMERVSKRSANIVSGAWIKAAGSIYGVIKAWDMAKLGARADQEMNSFKNMAASYGANAGNILRDLKRVSAGTVDTMSLVRSAGTAMMMGIAPDKVTKLMEIARATAKLTGQTVVAAFEDISRGTARSSKLLLDNLGIMVTVGKANEEWARANNRAVESMTDMEKKVAFMNATVEAGADLMQRLGKQTKTTAEWFQSAEAFVTNLKVALGKGFIGAAKMVAIVFTRIGQVFNMVMGDIFGLWKKFLGLIEKLPGPHGSRVKELKEDVAGIEAHFRGAVSQADQFISQLANLQSGTGGITAPNLGMGGAGAGGGGGGDEDTSFADNATMQLEAALVQRTQMEIFMASSRHQALQEMETTHREWEMETLTSSSEYKTALLQSEHDMALALSQQKNKALAANELKMMKIEEANASAKMSIAVNLGMAMLNFAGTNSEAMFAIQKVAQIGMAIMAAFLASNLALATFPGPPYTVPLAAAVLKAGLINAAVIGSMAIGEYAASKNTGATGAGSYVSPVVTTPSVKAPATVSEPQQAEQRGTLTINIQGDFIGDEAYIDTLVEKINDAEDRDVFINQSVYARETL